MWIPLLFRPLCCVRARCCCLTERQIQTSERFDLDRVYRQHYNNNQLTTLASIYVANCSASFGFTVHSVALTRGSLQLHNLTFQPPHHIRPSPLLDIDHGVHSRSGGGAGDGCEGTVETSPSCKSAVQWALCVMVHTHGRCVVLLAASSLKLCRPSFPSSTSP